jgi:hypothetical protein
MKNHLPLSPNTADSSEWPKMWNGTGRVEAERFATGRTCDHVATTYPDAVVYPTFTVWGEAVHTADCTTVLSVYNNGPLCHSHNRKADPENMNGATV